MTIVHARKPKPRTKAQAHAAPPPIAAIVAARKPGPRQLDPETEADTKAWFAKNIRPPGA